MLFRSKNGLIDLSDNTCYMDGVPYKENHSAAEYHEYLYNKGPKFNSEGKLDENGPFSKIGRASCRERV